MSHPSDDVKDYVMSTSNSTRNLGVTAAVVGVVVAILAGFAIAQSMSDSGSEGAGGTGAQVVRSESHRLDEVPDAEATLVEFLDFECEACGAAYPFIEDLRERYEGELEFVIRYFPLDGHANSRNAAHAVEAASRQGELEAMYQRMFDAQAQWGEQQESQAPLFRSWAEELGLDMEQYDRDVDSDDVAERVERDFQDGSDLDVSGTPTFFLNGEKLEPQSEQDFYDAIDAALEN